MSDANFDICRHCGGRGCYKIHCSAFVCEHCNGFGIIKHSTEREKEERPKYKGHIANKAVTGYGR